MSERCNQLHVLFFLNYAFLLLFSVWDHKASQRLGLHYVAQVLLLLYFKPVDISSLQVAHFASPRVFMNNGRSCKSACKGAGRKAGAGEGSQRESRRQRERDLIVNTQPRAH